VSNTIDVEFSLALHDKTGKYFIGRDICSTHDTLIHQQLFWRFAARRPPQGVTARIIGRLLAIEVDQRARSSLVDQLTPRIRRARPVLHMDPLTTLLHRVSAQDVVLCHDVGPLTHPHLFHADVSKYYRKAYDEIAAAGPYMVFVSLASSKAFHALYRGRFAGSRVIYPAVRTEVRQGAQLRPAGVSKPFLLTVGSIGARKNQRRAIEAFRLSDLSSEGFAYVLCGSREMGWEAVIDTASATEGVVLLDYVADEELNWLYANAAGFVLPSLLEGFGIPVAEAISRGLTAVVSRGSVLQEVAGDGALAVDAEDTRDIAAAMRRLAGMSRSEANERQAAATAGLQRFSPQAFESGWREVIEQAAGLEPHGPMTERGWLC
jgi:glycosyltransferase involved in cell wall biosynthesis